MLEKFLPRTEFSSYEDFIENYKVNIPENFNFAYDVMDEWAAQCPEDPSLHWCNEENCDRILSFAEIKRLSDKTANALKDMGIRKGDRVMLILMQRVEVWTTMLALQKIGAVTIPVTFLLTPKDIIYRCNAAKVKMIVSVDMPEVVQHIQDSLAQCETVENGLPRKGRRGERALGAPGGSRGDGNQRSHAHLFFFRDDRNAQNDSA